MDRPTRLFFDEFAPFGRENPAGLVLGLVNDFDGVDGPLRGLDASFSRCRASCSITSR